MSALVNKNISQTKLWLQWKVPQRGYSTMTYYSFEHEESIKNEDISYGLALLIKRLLKPDMSDKYVVARFYQIKGDFLLVEVKNGECVIPNNLPLETKELIYEIFKSNLNLND